MCIKKLNMPIEIRELHIKVTVDSNEGAGAGGAGTTASSSGGESDREALVAECVEQVLTILREKQER